MSDLQGIAGAVDRFLHKAANKNEPLESFREQESFKQFKGKIAKGMRKQAAWLGDNLDQVDYLFDDSEGLDFEAQFGYWLANNMPRIHEYVAETKVYTYLNNAFVTSILAQYARIGIIEKAEGTVQFELTNPHYIAALKNQANYLLRKSSIDETTRKKMIMLIADNRLSTGDINDLADILAFEFEGVSETRGFLIANTESNQAMSTAQQAFLVENGISTKEWVPAGPSTCQLCQGNADQGPIGTNDNFESGHQTTPGHPGCECYIDGGEIDIDEIPIWNGS